MKHKTADCMKWPTYSISFYTWNALHIGNKLHMLSLEWNESLNEIKNRVETKGRQLKSPGLLINPNSWKKYWLCRISSWPNHSINAAANQMVVVNKSYEFLNKLMLLDIYDANKCQWLSEGKFSLIFSRRLRISMKGGLRFTSWAQHCSVNLRTWKAKVQKITSMIQACSERNKCLHAITLIA